MTSPPLGLPRCRFIWGLDDAGFCQCIPEALELGRALHGSPAIAFEDFPPGVAQALPWAGKSQLPRT